MLLCDCQSFIKESYLLTYVITAGVYYADLPCKLLLAIEEKRRGKLTLVPLLLHDSAPRRSHVGQAAVIQI